MDTLKKHTGIWRTTLLLDVQNNYEKVADIVHNIAHVPSCHITF